RPRAAKPSFREATGMAHFPIPFGASISFQQYLHQGEPVKRPSRVQLHLPDLTGSRTGEVKWPYPLCRTLRFAIALRRVCRCFYSVIRFVSTPNFSYSFRHLGLTARGALLRPWRSSSPWNQPSLALSPLRKILCIEARTGRIHR